MNQDFAYGCIIIKDGRVLLEKQKHREERFWGFPKGHKEGDETDEESAIREVREEVGLNVEITDHHPILMEYDIRAEERNRENVPVGETIHKTVKLFFAKPLNDSIALQEAEVETASYFSYDEVEEKLSFEDAKAAWREAKKRIVSQF